MKKVGQSRPTSYGEEGNGEGYDMNTEKRDLKKLFAVLQKEADKIGPVDPEFDQKAFSDDQ